MPRFEVTGPDGHKYQVEGPEGATEQDALAQVQKQVAAPPAEAAPAGVDDYGRPMGPATFNAGPDISTTIRNALAPAPNTTYGDVVPLAKDDTTGAVRLALPNMIRSPLIGLTQEGGQSTINPETGTLGITPEAQSVAPFFASPLRIGPMGAVPPGLAAREAPLSGEFRANPMAPTAVTRVTEAGNQPVTIPGPTAPTPFQPPAAAGPPAVTPTGIPATPPPAAPAPAGMRAAGAQATPSYQTTLTAQEAAEYGSTADKQWLYKSLPPGEVDATEYVKGIVPTMAQREQSVIAARETKAARNLSPAADQAERELLDEHNTIRKDAFQLTAGSDVTQGIAVREANKNIDDALTAAYSAGGKVDAQPIVEAIQAELDAPSGKLPPVRAVMATVQKALQKADESGLENDPRQVHGVRRVINFLQSKQGIAENPAYGARDVQAALIRVKEAIDAAIEPAAPGFRQAIADYATAQRAIEAQEALQKAEPKLMDDKGRLQFSRFHRFMSDVIKSRDPNAPLNPYQSLTEAQMNQLKSLHDDLMRVASADDLAKARGSDTTPNLLDAVKQTVRGVPGTIAAGLAGQLFGGPIGAVTGAGIKSGVEGIFSRRAETAATRKMEGLLRPDPAKYPTRQNPLLSP